MEGNERGPAADRHPGKHGDIRCNLYGTTKVGGTFGTVFRFDTRSNVLITLHSFTGADGKNPVAGLVRDPQGNLYGVTAFGGTLNKGTLFRVTS